MFLMIQANYLLQHKSISCVRNVKWLISVIVRELFAQITVSIVAVLSSSEHHNWMYLISAVLPIISLLCFKLGSLTVTPDQVKRQVDGNAMLDEQIVDMNPENMKLIDQDFKDSLYFDENNLEEELASSEKKIKTNAMTNLIIIVVAIVLSIATFCGILIILCRKYGLCKKKKWWETNILWVS